MGSSFSAGVQTGCSAWARRGVVCAALMACASAQAADDPRQVSRGEFQADVTRMTALTEACKGAASACVAKNVLSDERVGSEGAQAAFAMRWEWLRSAVEDAAKAKPEDRVRSMTDAEGHLAELAHAPGVDREARFAKARAEATRVLAGGEFPFAPGPTWMQRQIARFWMWMAVVFGGIGKLGESAPWLGSLVEVALYAGAAVGILLFLQRVFARQRLAIALGAGTVKSGAWDKEAADWSALADSCAARQEWREAVHCLYWAAIVRLESRRAWRHNPTRTPREYVRLLKPGSTQQGALRSLTQIFERVWYGLRDASDEDYRQARSLFDGLSQGEQTAGNA